MSSGAVNGTVTFHFSTTPVATSSWCVDGCQPPGRPRCCIRLEPRFDLFRLLAGVKHAPGYRRLMRTVPTDFSFRHLVLTVRRNPAVGHCGLWTPAGCRLPVAAKPDPCRHYVCKVDLFQGRQEAEAVLDEYNRFWLALAEHELAEEDLPKRARELFTSHLKNPGTHREGPLPALFRVLDDVQPDYEEYLARRAEFVRAYLGRDARTLTVSV